MPEAVTPFLTAVPEYRVGDDGILYVETDGWSVCMSIRTGERGMARMRRAIAEYRAKRAEVIQFERKLAGHAASR